MKSDSDSVYLAPAEYVDSDHPAIIALARKAGGASPVEKARRYYLAAREVRYDPDLWVIEIEDVQGRHFLTEKVDLK